METTKFIDAGDSYILSLDDIEITIKKKSHVRTYIPSNNHGTIIRRIPKRARKKFNKMVLHAADLNFLYEILKDGKILQRPMEHHKPRLGTVR
jgi:hypothetical protein